MNQLFLTLALVALSGCATVGPATGVAARVRVTSQNTFALRIKSAELLSIDGRNAVSGWVHGRSTGVLPPSHLDVVILNGEQREVARQTVPIRLQRRRHGAPYPDRFTVAFDPWPADAVEVIVTPHSGIKHDSLSEK
ncbi:MAG: hypothetical protein KF715_14950 [Candidatus Didemnitutus sp.]|nr:hypothetical protein [Candidatus Didemnitutus sp.]